MSNSELSPPEPSEDEASELTPPTSDHEGMYSEAKSGAESEDSVSDVIDATTIQWLALPKGKARIANADATGPICHRKPLNAEWGVGITSAMAAEWFLVQQLLRKMLTTVAESPRSLVSILSTFDH